MLASPDHSFVGYPFGQDPEACVPYELSNTLANVYRKAWGIDLNHSSGQHDILNYGYVVDMSLIELSLIIDFIPTHSKLIQGTISLLQSN